MRIRLMFLASLNRRSRSSRSLSRLRGLGSLGPKLSGDKLRSRLSLRWRLPLRWRLRERVRGLRARGLRGSPPPSELDRSDRGMPSDRERLTTGRGKK